MEEYSSVVCADKFYSAVSNYIFSTVDGILLLNLNKLQFELSLTESLTHWMHFQSRNSITPF